MSSQRRVLLRILLLIHLHYSPVPRLKSFPTKFFDIDIFYYFGQKNQSQKIFGYGKKNFDFEIFVLEYSESILHNFFT